MTSAQTIPVIDPSVKHVGVSKLREMNIATLRRAEDTFVIQDNDQPLAVLLTYEKFMAMQQQLHAVLNTIDLFMDANDLDALRTGLEDLKAGRVRSFDQIEAEIQATR